MSLTGVFGSLLKESISEKIKNTLMTGVRLCVLYIGISGISTNTNIMILIISITISAIVGEIIDIDYKLNRFDTFIQQKVTYKDDKVRLFSASTTSNQYMR